MCRLASHRAVLGTLLLCPVLLLPAGSLGEERTDETERWVPSASFLFEVIAHPMEAEIESSDIFGPPLDYPDPTPPSQEGCQNRRNPPGFTPGELCLQPIPSDQPLTPPNRGSDLTSAALVSLAFELMSPSLIQSLGRPRLFAHADGSLVFGSKRKLAGEGSPSRLKLPPPVLGLTVNVNEGTIKGRGNRAFSELKNGVLAAGAGVAFTFDVWDRRIRVKPSVEYLYQRVEFQGLANRPIQLRGSNIFRPRNLTFFRLVGFRDSKTVTQHGLGGGIEFEIDTQRLGPFMLSVFLGGRVYELLGDLDETLTSNQNVFGDTYVSEATGESPERVTWHFRPESRVWRGGVGLRFRYLPE